MLQVVWSPVPLLIRSPSPPYFIFLRFCLFVLCLFPHGGRGHKISWTVAIVSCVSDTHIWNWNEHMSKIQQKNISLSKFLMWSMLNKILLFGSKEVYQDVYYGLKWPWGRWDDSLPKKLTLTNMYHWKNAFSKCTYHFLSLTDG